MRTLATVLSATALTLMLIAVSGVHAAPVSVPTVAPSSSGQSSDDCANENQEVPNSCFETPYLGPGMARFYIDTGQADGIRGIWLESNNVLGLQKIGEHVPGQTQTGPSDTPIVP
jgi:hypothetical protein